MPDFQDNIKRLLLWHEGYRQKPYLDTEGIVTIGIGFNLDEVGLSLEESLLVLEHRLRAMRAELINALPEYNRLSSARKAVMLDMTYNLGVPRFRGFKKMWQAVRDRNWSRAAEEMLDSKWARQVGARATRLAEMMRSGEWPDFPEEISI
ncbi:MAG: hypothetical protein QNJ97_17895 [Myxococcota bacterium]|nr:hypothetical protein [Myxococcota bacterium]